MFFGVDNTWDYNVGYCREVLEADQFLLAKLCVTEAQREKYFSKNYLRFIGG